MQQKPTVEVCFSPQLYDYKLTTGDFSVVVADILRATTSICAAFAHGVQEIIPVSGLEEARAMKEKGYFVACERNGEVMDFADIGNSASDFLRPDLVGQRVVFSTTNGTKTIHKASDAKQVLIGSFANLAALTQKLTKNHGNVVIFCAAWKNLFNLEDAVFAGALAQELLQSGFITVCDATLGAVDLWNQAKPDLKKYLSKSSHRNRLRHLVSDEDFDYTVTLNTTSVVPVLQKDRLMIGE